MRGPTTVCAFLMGDGRRCGAARQREGTYCFMHDPDRAEDAAEARRLGGLRRRRESTLEAAYDLGDLASVDGIRRLLDIVVSDALAADGGVNRQRVLIAVSHAATRLLEVGDFEARIRALEEAWIERPKDPQGSVDQ